MSTPTTARPATTRPAPAAGAADSATATTGFVTRRAAALTAAALTTMAATVFLAPAPHAAAASASAPVESALAGAAITELTSGGPGSLAAIPDDFPAEFGYRPSTLDGLVVNPQGDCSSPVTLPAEFETACKAHDLGYDLLRYAEQRGQTLGPWARQALDSTLDRHMHESCESRVDPFSRARCNAMATIASTFVDLNSRRQGYGAPIAESGFGLAQAGSASSWQLLGVIGAGVAGLGAVLTMRNKKRTRPNPMRVGTAALGVQA
ncbi:hypothetical protein DFR70_105394 [Nocardia tenerifensis]|uniref:Phospholipase A2-like protein n=1 Tax=Nocardia tenerifensis TaxID=228006 RepID=A0A318K0H0_9NOCA|nr:hypothetical protein [Nocardia tenerifensis]PXX64209.1 hypothetical protein DFR70_105394 [Nocardia tenerifensis]